MLAELIPKLAGMQQNDQQYYHRASNAGTEKCLRQQVYQALGVEAEPLPGRAIVLFDDSNWHEELSLEWIRKSVYKVHSQQMALDIPLFKSPFLPERTCKICKKKVATGDLHIHIDGIITDLNGEDYLLEHKAINHFTFEAYETGNLIPYDYFTQTIMYLIGLEKVTGKLLKGILLIKNKNTSRYLEYIVEYDKQEDMGKATLNKMDYKNNPMGALVEVKDIFVEKPFATAINRFKQIDKYVAEKKLPIRPFTPDSWRCDYCRYGKKCWKGYDAEVNNRNKDAVKLDKEICKIACDFYKLNQEKKDIEKQVDKLKSELNKSMVEKNAKLGSAGDFIVTLTPRTSSSIDKEQIPPEILAKAIKKKVYEILSVKQIKREGK